MSGNYGLPEDRFFQTSLLLNVFRGKDSTGAFRVLKGSGNVEVQKTMLPSPVALYSNDDPMKEFLNRTGHNVLVGHCRAATRGKVTIENAHPFEFDNVVGVHNGTISLKFKGSDDFETDSEGLYKLINDHGIEEALKEVESNYSTAYALAFYDKKTGLMNFVRNTERPLHFTYLYNNATLAFSSESWVLRQAAAQIKQSAGMGTHTVLGDGKKGDLFTLNKHQLFTVNPKDTREYTLKELKIPAKAYYQYASGGQFKGHQSFWDGYNEGYYGSGTGIHQSNVTPINKNLTKKERKELAKANQSSGYATGYDGENLSYALFQKYLAMGCCLCSKTPINSTKERDRMVWISSDSYACGDCAEGEHKDLVADWTEAGLNKRTAN